MATLTLWKKFRLLAVSGLFMPISGCNQSSKLVLFGMQGQRKGLPKEVSIM
ncbi:hypothetical protein ES332_A12G073700v1 [Gossypium tomentosum]|uniref:Uncharacterized protein n=1 Tax=Gossypium tomentosum TaxID=34277 RepID=A0A5D2MWX1_GOSTO|nr:hypothetical protein ES332_A12G073700v1 [Gossypium tomentosum]